MGGGAGVPPMDFARMMQTGAVPSNLEELTRRIEELKTVEQWLSFNLQMLRTTIQGMEVQHGTLAALRSMQESFGMGLGGETSGGKSSGGDPSEGSAHGMADGARRATEAGQAWWNAVQQQFSQMASAAQAFHAAPADGASDANSGGAKSGGAEARDAAPEPGIDRGTQTRKPSNPPKRRPS